MNHQMQKRGSIVYLLAVVVTVVMLMTAVAQTPTTRTYTTDADFDEYLEATTKTYTGLTTGSKVIRVTQRLNGIESAYTEVIVGTSIGEEYWA